MSATEYYNRSGYPTTGAAGSSSAARSEFELIKTGFGKLPDLSGNGSKIVAVNSGGSALEAITTTGTGNGVRATSPTLVTPNIGAATATSINGLGITSSTGTLTIANGKTLTFSNTLTFTGTDSSSVAFGTGGTVAYTANKLSVFASTSSSELAGVISDETGSGALVFADTPTLIAPILGTPTSGTLTNCTGLPISSGVSGLGSNVAAFLATPSSANLISAVTDETGTGALVFANTPTLVTPILGTPTSGNLSNCTGLPVSSGISGLASGVATFLATPSSANFASMITDETGSGSVVLATSPTLTTPTLGVASATSINKVAITAPASSATLTIADGKTLTVSRTLTLTGTDSTTMTFPSTSATLARTDAGNTFTGAQTINASSGTALKVTNTGSGDSLLIEDSTSTDSTPFLVDASGNTVVGHTSALTFSRGTTNLQSHGTSGGSVGIGAATWVNSATNNPNLVLAKSRSGTVGTHTILQSGDTIGQLNFEGSDGTGFIQAAGIFSQVDGTPGTNDMPGRLTFYTTADGASTLTERMRIDSAGQIGFGGAATAGVSILAVKNMTGAVAASSIKSNPTIASDVTNTGYNFYSRVLTSASAFTLTTLTHYHAEQGTIGAGSAVTSQYGFVANSSLTGATNNYGFYGDIASGTGRYNLYMNGTASNYLAGNLGIGSTPTANVNLGVYKNLTGGVSAYQVMAEMSVQSDVTTDASGFRTNISTAAASFTLGELTHFRAGLNSIGAGSAITTQMGFHARSSLTGATNNYGFRGSIASASNTFNLYMDGTAPNYFAGDMQFDKTITAAGTTGARTINKNAGSVNFAAAATSLVVTDSRVTTSSVIVAVVATNDATMTSVQAVAGSGSFTLYANAAATAETRVNFLIIN